MYTRSAQLIVRSTATFLALVCFWMSGVITTMHTDDYQGLFPVKNVQAPHLGRLVAIPPQEACIACEWNALGRTFSAAGLSIPTASLYQVIRPDTLTEALHLRPFDHTSDRAPPASLS